MSIPPTILKKRNFEDILEASDQTANKRSSPATHLPETSFHLFELSEEMLVDITILLDHCSLLNFELSCKRAQESTLIAWKEKKVQQLVNFEWQMTQKEPYPHKWDYCINQVLHQYVLIDKYPKALASNLDMAQRIYAKFAGIMERFPILQNYMANDLKRLADIDYSCPPEAMTHFNKAILEGKYAGEMLLKGLMHSREPQNIQLIQQCFHQAINKKATCASLFMLELEAVNSMEIQSAQWDLAAEAAAQQDHRALCSLVEQYGLIGIANAAFEKLKLGQWKDANRLYTLADTYGENYPTGVLAGAAFVKLKLNQWQDADQLYSMVIDASLNHPAEIFAHAAFVKLMLNQWQDAHHLYIRAFEAYGENIPAEAIANAALVKMKLDQTG